jgi:transposase InsO family protein
MVEKERKLMPRIGGRKLMHLIQPGLPKELRIGRDTFFDFLRDNGLLVRKRRNRARTTYSSHWLRKYPNLIAEFTPQRAHQLLVSDITYIVTGEGFCYLSLVTDGYSRKVVGWELGKTLEAKHSVKALKMAIRQLPRGTRGVYHHSDRGVQYCSDEYVKLLNKNYFKISMTESGDPRENAVAERVNGILKEEWLNNMTFKTMEEVLLELNKVIKIYNHNRPHSSLDMQTPDQAHTLTVLLKRRWKNYYKRQSNDSFVETSKILT